MPPPASHIQKQLPTYLDGIARFTDFVRRAFARIQRILLDPLLMHLLDPLINLMVITALTARQNAEMNNQVSSIRIEERGRRMHTSSVLSPKKWISSNPSFSTCLRAYVLSQPVGKTSKDI
jgi:hypothetical protein